MECNLASADRRSKARPASKAKQIRQIGREIIQSKSLRRILNELRGYWHVWHSEKNEISSPQYSDIMLRPEGVILEKNKLCKHRESIKIKEVRG